MDWGPRGTSNIWFDRRDDNERNVMCASQSVNIGERCHNGFCTDKKDSINYLGSHPTCEQRNNFQRVLQSAVPFACPPEPRLEIEKSRDVRCWRVLRKHCLHAACQDRRLAAQGSMLVVQTMLEVTFRWSARMPPSRGLAWRFVGVHEFPFCNLVLSSLLATVLVLSSE